MKSIQVVRGSKSSGVLRTAVFGWLMVIMTLGPVAGVGQQSMRTYTPDMAVEEINELLQVYRTYTKKRGDRRSWSFRKLLAQGHNRVRKADLEMANDNYESALLKVSRPDKAYQLLADIGSILKRIGETVEHRDEAIVHSPTYHVFNEDRRKIEEIWPGPSREGDVLRKVTHHWGGVYYFKRDTSVSAATWLAVYNQLPAPSRPKFEEM